jgi:site-specific DNA recombinase
VLRRLAAPDAADLLFEDVDRDGLRSDLTRLRARRDDLAALLADGLLTASAVRTQANVLGQRIGELEERLSAAHPGASMMALADSADVEVTWNALDLRQQREVIRNLASITILPAGKGVRWSPDQLKIDWKRV